jgi:hypothetical protein
MKKIGYFRIKYYFILSLFSFLFLCSIDSFAQNSKTQMTAKHEHQMTNPKMTNDDLKIVRKGTIDLKAIDRNKDGKVFQDPMDWNVISDKPGKCPLCKMTLEEVTLDQAKNNLIKNGFKVKETKSSRSGKTK